MKTLRKSILMLFVGTTMFSMTSCKSFKKLTKQEKGILIGAAGGAAAGGAIGSKSKNPAVYAIIGSAVGGVAGAVIGKYMDKQADELNKKLGSVAQIERIEEGIKVTMSSGILFGFDSHKLSETSKDNLGKLATILKDYKETNIVINGYTDNVGSDRYNKNLSVKRAKEVSDYMGQMGIDSKRFTVVGYGEEFPVADNETEQNRLKNRRVELAIMANDNLKNDAAKAGASTKK